MVFSDWDCHRNRILAVSSLGGLLSVALCTANVLTADAPNAAIGFCSMLGVIGVASVILVVRWSAI